MFRDSILNTPRSIAFITKSESCRVPVVGSNPDGSYNCFFFLNYFFISILFHLKYKRGTDALINFDIMSAISVKLQ